MSRLFSIDPGLRECGVAVFEDGRLVAGRLARYKNGDGPKQWTGMADAVIEVIKEFGRRRPTDELIIEYMQTRKGRRDAHDALIQLSQVSGAIYYGSGCDSIHHAPANKWTSGRKKPVNHPRIRRRLDAEEKKALEEALAGCPRGNHKEILDAVGIGLWHLRRL